MNNSTSKSNGKVFVKLKLNRIMLLVIVDHHQEEIFRRFVSIFAFNFIFIERTL